MAFKSTWVWQGFECFLLLQSAGKCQNPEEDCELIVTCSTEWEWVIRLHPHLEQGKKALSQKHLAQADIG